MDQLCSSICHSQKFHYGTLPLVPGLHGPDVAVGPDGADVAASYLMGMWSPPCRAISPSPVGQNVHATRWYIVGPRALWVFRPPSPDKGPAAPVLVLRASRCGLIGTVLMFCGLRLCPIMFSPRLPSPQSMIGGIPSSVVAQRGWPFVLIAGDAQKPYLRGAHVNAPAGKGAATESQGRCSAVVQSCAVSTPTCNGGRRHSRLAFLAVGHILTCSRLAVFLVSWWCRSVACFLGLYWRPPPNECRGHAIRSSSS